MLAEFKTQAGKSKPRLYCGVPVKGPVTQPRRELIAASMMAADQKPRPSFMPRARLSIQPRCNDLQALSANIRKTQPDRVTDDVAQRGTKIDRDQLQSHFSDSPVSPMPPTVPQKSCASVSAEQRSRVRSASTISISSRARQRSVAIWFLP